MMLLQVAKEVKDNTGLPVLLQWLIGIGVGGLLVELVRGFFQRRTMGANYADVISTSAVRLLKPLEDRIKELEDQLKETRTELALAYTEIHEMRKRLHEDMIRNEEDRQVRVEDRQIRHEDRELRHEDRERGR